MIIQELNKPYIIAEIGCNHNGDTELGLKMIKAAKDCGAVKFQKMNWTLVMSNLKMLISGKIKN